MKKVLTVFLVIMSMITFIVIPATGIVPNEIVITNNSNVTNHMRGNYNLVQQIHPTRIIFPRIYWSGSIATIDAYVINEGPDDSGNFTVEMKWIGIFGYNSKEILDVKVGEYLSLPAGYRRHIYFNLECYITNNIINFGMNIYDIQIINTANDLNPDDNTASFTYIVIGY